MEDIRVINARGCAILLIEHDMGLVRGLAHRVVALDHGVKVVEGSYHEVCTNPQVIEAYLGVGVHARSLPSQC
jgi:branched-chain amino acid transport system ATP-binding protein